MLKTCSDAAPPAGRLNLHGPTMGTRWSAALDGVPAPDAPPLQRALADAVRLVDEQMSPFKPGSALVRFNRAAVGSWVTLPPQTLTVLARALEIARLSSGAFDPTVGALVDAWGFGAAHDAPDAAAIHSTRVSDPDHGHLQLELDTAAGRARKHAPLQIDLCGIAKGHAVDRMAAVLQQHGVQHALLALDGELRALGPQACGQPWPVAVESPEAGRRAVHAVIELQDLAIATSGDYRRFWQVQGQRLAHNMDPCRAAPVRNDVASVTVLAPRCIDADAWATALLVAGAGPGLALAQRLGLEALFLLRRDGRLTELGTGRFTLAAA